MKISVIGNIIDTINIYQISKIFEIDHLSSRSEIIRKDIQFHIYLLNEPKQITPYLNLSSDIDSKTYELALKRVNELRDNLINIWNNNKSTLPILDIGIYDNAPSDSLEIDSRFWTCWKKFPVEELKEGLLIGGYEIEGYIDKLDLDKVYLVDGRMILKSNIEYIKKRIRYQIID